ncbi:phosphotransferase family protein [Nocardia sp. NPDC052566]|uniref:phosphotransferase family protein n=1 Tax=Nocardia sp. NPDC052566 TaxID=3364330 RepID=UPI0037C54E17
MLEWHRDLLTALLPGESVSGLQVREGQFHGVVLGATIVVCFARTESAAARLPERAATLHALRKFDLGVAVPELLGAGVDDGVPYLVLTRIPGAPIEPEVLADPDMEHVVRHCHQLLTRLAAAAVDPSVSGGSPCAATDRRSVSAADPAAGGVLSRTPADHWSVFAADVRAELYPLMTDSGTRRAERELTAVESLSHRITAVIHGDLGGENLLWETVDGLPVLRGVIDWDAASLGDPAEDYAALGATYGPGFLQRLLHLSADANALATRITTIQGTFALQQALAAHRDGDAAELDDGLMNYR